jgi:hypothetical protein
VGLTRDRFILSRRLRQVHKLPWCLPAVLLIKLTDEDLDGLDIAERAGRDSYWLCLNRIVHRLTEGKAKERR